MTPEGNLALAAINPELDEVLTVYIYAYALC